MVEPPPFKPTPDDRNVFNLTFFELVEVGEVGIQIKPWMEQWCAKNLSSHSFEWFHLVDDCGERTGGRRIGIVIHDPDDIVLFYMRWRGEYDIDGPFAENEMKRAGPMRSVGIID